jgi:hypothetical protein
LQEAKGKEARFRETRSNQQARKKAIFAAEIQLPYYLIANTSFAARIP